MEVLQKDDIHIYRFPLGELSANCYVLADTDSGKCIVIDAADDGAFIGEFVVRNNWVVTDILATHGHFDHNLAAFEVQTAFNARFAIHETDAFLLKRMRETAQHFLGHIPPTVAPAISSYLKDTASLSVGDHEFAFKHVPGHTPGSMAFVVDSLGVAFVGDTVFAGGGVGRYDFSYSDEGQLRQSVRTILSLPDTMILLPGHGEELTVEQAKTELAHML